MPAMLLESRSSPKPAPAFSLGLRSCPVPPSLSQLQAMDLGPPSPPPRSSLKSTPSRSSGLSRLSCAPVEDSHGSLGDDPCAYEDLRGPSSFVDTSSFDPSAFQHYSYGSSTSPVAGSPVFSDAFPSLHKFLPSNHDDDEKWPSDSWPAVDAYSCDEFRMYEFKVRRCMRGRSHDWTECPFAHPGEKARRRDPRRFHYSGAACPEFRKGSCKRGDACEYAHGVFECWLHPARYRTQPCKDGRNCKRWVCFFAHTVEQLRVLPSATVVASSSSSPSPSPSPKMPCYDGSPLRQALAGGFSLESQAHGGSLLDDCYGVGKLLDDQAYLSTSPRLHTLMMGKKIKPSSNYGLSSYGVSSSPTSTLVGHANSPPPLSPPLSPSISPPMSPVSSNGWRPLLSGVPIPAHRRHLNRLRSVPTISIPSLGEDLGEAVGSDVSPIAASASSHAVTDMMACLQGLQLKSANEGQWQPPYHHLFHQSHTQAGPLHFPPSTLPQSFPRVPQMSEPMSSSRFDPLTELPSHRVESGRDLRAEIYGRIGKENGVSSELPDVGWVNELLK